MLGFAGIGADWFHLQALPNPFAATIWGSREEVGNCVLFLLLSAKQISRKALKTRRLTGKGGRKNPSAAL